MIQVQQDAALREWSQAVGAQNVITTPAALRAAETGTFATRHRIPAIVRPASRGEVQECMRIATRRRVPVYPISSGKNWGYGSRVPASDGCVLLDLGRMNRIVDFNEDLAYVTVEPGVTQAQLFAFLKERNSKLWMDATGASPECSMIGNTMDRGFGHTPYGDHFANSCGLEIVLPNGSVVETGLEMNPFAPISRARSANSRPTTALSIRTGIFLVAASFRRAIQTWYPSIMGIIRSTMIRSGHRFCASASPSCGSAARIAVCPDFFRMMLTRVRIAESSSIISIFAIGLVASVNFQFRASRLAGSPS